MASELTSVGAAVVAAQCVARESRLQFTVPAPRGDGEEQEVFSCHILHGRGCGSAAWVQWQPGQCKMLSLLSPAP